MTHNAPSLDLASRLDDAGARLAELFQFERLLAELSAGFVNISPSRVDAAITDALHRIARLLDVDRATLLRVRADGVLSVTHSASIDGIPPVPINLVPSYPWTFSELRADRQVVFSHVDQLPEQAGVDKANWVRAGVRSNLTTPVVAAGAFQGGLALACLRRPREWSSDLVGRVRILADVFGNALVHQRAQLDLAAALAFEELMSRSFAAMLTAKRTALDDVITDALRHAAGVLDADRATLWQRLPGATVLHKTHRWLADGMPSLPDVSDGKLVPWLTAEMLAGRAVSGRVRDLPAEAAEDVPVLQSLGIGSMVMVPLLFGDLVAGALSFGSRRDEPGWPTSLVPRVQLFGELLSSVLARARAEQREDEARGEAAHASRIGTMGVVAASLAHELTQPLAAIGSNAETAVALLATEDINRAELRETAQDIRADAQRAGALIAQLRRFLRRSEVDRSQVDVRALLDEVLALVHGETVSRNVHLSLSADPALPAINANHAQMQQVLLNLLLNAFDAVAANTTLARHVGVRAFRTPRSIAIEVTDNGAGMDESMLMRVFTPYFTTKPSGMGLGLSISRSIAESHGGSLGARSSPDEGSTFVLELPVLVP